jgi:tripartite-type tricarboxylate transporter receptor subunit TctC
MTTMRLCRRQAIRALSVALGATLSAPALLRAQRPETMRILCGYPPGGSVDVVCRKLAERLAGRVATQVIVENRTGAAGRLAVDELKRAADATTMLITPASVVTMYPHVYRQLAYDPFTDLAPVSAVATTAFALAVGPKVPNNVTSVAELVHWCRTSSAAGAPAACGNAGAGSMPHFMAILAAREIGVELSHVPYRGGLMAMQAAAASEVALAIGTEGSARPLQQAGRLRVLATTWERRSPFFPEAPSFRDLGFAGLGQREWYGAFMPARSDPAMVSAAAEAIRAVALEADLRDAWERAGLAVETGTPAQLRAAMRAEHDFWATLVKGSGFTPES